MIQNLRAGARTVAEIANPRTAKRLYDAGALDPRSPLALARTLPWLLGRGPSLGILSRMNSLVLGGKPAVYDRNGILDFTTLDKRANRAANALTSLAGGRSVALLLRNGREFGETLLGAQKAGVVVFPLNTWAKQKELSATLANASAPVLVYDTAHSEQVAASAPPGVTLVAVGDRARAVKGSLDYEAVLADASDSQPAPFTRAGGRSSTVVIHTSGTTGTPKGAARDAAKHDIGAMAGLLQVIPYRRSDVVVCPAPMFHSFGLATFMFATAVGATLVLPDRFDPKESLELIERHHATAASFVPVMIRRIVELPAAERSAPDVSSLRIVVASGSALSEQLRVRAREVFGEVLYDLYGSTEAGWIAIATPEDMRRRPGTVGRPVPGVDVAVLSPEGEKLPPGEVGELCVKSRVLFEGYTSGEAARMRAGWLCLGDLGHAEVDGYLFVQGRADDMVVVGGENVYPVEVEHVVETIEGVSECAVFGRLDDELGHVLVAVAAGSATPEEIIEICKAELASYKVPRRVIVVDELPRTGTGKVIKRELAALFDRD